MSQLRVILIGWSCLFLSESIGEDNFNDNIHIRVLLERNVSSTTLHSLYGPLTLELSNQNKFPLGKDISIQWVKDKLIINGKNYAALPISIRSQKNNIVRYKDGYYQGEIRITPYSRQLLITNVIPLREYLIGTLHGETHPHWEMEALKAQAVASRSYALYMIKNPKSAYYDLEKGVQDQVFKGVEMESPKVRMAVESTNGIFLSEKNHPMKAYYHARCGGQTESSHFVWKVKSKNDRSIVCPYCKKNPYHWEVSIDKKEFIARVNLPQQDNELQMLPLEQSKSGRLASLIVKNKLVAKKLTSDFLRSLFGYNIIKSSLFNWEILPSRVLLKGMGFGHGVGMCQWGSNYLAKNKYSFEKILNHYYPSATLHAKPSFHALRRF